MVSTLSPSSYILSGRKKQQKKVVEHSHFFKTGQAAESHNSEAWDFLNFTLTSQQNRKPTCRDPQEQEDRAVFRLATDNCTPSPLYSLNKQDTK